MADNEIMIIDELALKDKVYTVRGELVMLDYELAELYGYTTKAFNQQVKNNIERFDSDFRFELTKEEWADLRSNILTSSWGGRRTPPHAFTEQGIYMLMTVLRGDLATQQSKNLIRLFKQMKDFIIDAETMFVHNNYSVLLDRIFDHERRLGDHDRSISELIDNSISKSELTDFMKLFDQSVEKDEIIIFDGEPFKADAAYQKMYRSAKKSIIIIDDYIGVKTLQHLAHIKPEVKVTIISDNKHNGLKMSEYNDFLTEYPFRLVDFIRSKNRVHDRFIVLDKGTAGMKVYLCGGSSKDAGKRITTISRFKDIDIIKRIVDELLENDSLTLK